MTNQGKKLANLSIPTIPSRFLTPILKFDLHEKDQGYDLYDTVIGANQEAQNQESILVAKVARLTNDGRAVGPGSYDPKHAHERGNPRGSPNMAIDRTVRADLWEAKGTERQVGPGAYHAQREVDRTIKNPTIARGQLWRTADRITKKRKNKGSIRADFEGDDTSSDEEALPGPGAHLKSQHITTFNKQEYLHDHPQQFGSCQSRFVDPQRRLANSLGPGEYLSQNLLTKFAPKAGTEGTGNFKTAPRKDGMIHKGQLGAPGPQDYAADPAKKGPKKSGHRHPFDVKV